MYDAFAFESKISLKRIEPKNLVFYRRGQFSFHKKGSGIKNHTLFPI